MREFQVPDFKTVAYVGSAWFAAIALVFMIPTYGIQSFGDLVGREILGALMLVLAVYLFRLGWTFKESGVISRVMVRESIRPVDETKRAA